MPCYGCGSEKGDTFRLCAECVALKKSHREGIREELLRAPEVDSVHNELTTKLRYKIALLIGIWALSLITTTLFGEKLIAGQPQTAGATLILSILITSLLVYSLTAIYFWVGVATQDVGWLILCILVPIACYYYVIRYWDETKWLFMVNIASFVLTISMRLLLYTMQTPTSL